MKDSFSGELDLRLQELDGDSDGVHWADVPIIPGEVSRSGNTVSWVASQGYFSPGATMCVTLLQTSGPNEISIRWYFKVERPGERCFICTIDNQPEKRVEEMCTVIII